jgi:hypothetical protein
MTALPTNRPTPVRVSRTGLALVHEGEVVYPATGSEAEAVRLDSAGVVTYVFPVVIEVCRAGDEIDTDDIIERTLRHLIAGLAAVQEG